MVSRDWLDLCSYARSKPVVRATGVLRRFIGSHSYVSPAIILVERPCGAYQFDQLLRRRRNTLEGAATNQFGFASASGCCPVYGCYASSGNRIDYLRRYFPDFGPRNNAFRLLALRTRMVCRRRNWTLGFCSIPSNICASMGPKKRGIPLYIASADRC
jgi:hypothetical protein